MEIRKSGRDLHSQISLLSALWPPNSRYREPSSRSRDDNHLCRSLLRVCMQHTYLHIHTLREQSSSRVSSRRLSQGQQTARALARECQRLTSPTRAAKSWRQPNRALSRGNHPSLSHINSHTFIFDVFVPHCETDVTNTRLDIFSDIFNDSNKNNHPSVIIRVNITRKVVLFPD